MWDALLVPVFCDLFMADDQATYLASPAAFLSQVQEALARYGNLSEAARKARSFDELRRELTLSDELIADALASCCNLPRISYEGLRNNRGELASFSGRFLREARLYPFRLDPDTPALALCDPPTQAIIRSAELVFQKTPELFITGRETIEALLAEVVGDREASDTLDRSAPLPIDDIDSLRDLASGAPVVRALNDLLDKAFEVEATDLHIEPMQDRLSIRLRIDGLLKKVNAPPLALAPGLISRLKILSGLNIAERRLPQDGSARVTLNGTKVDLRIAIMPTAYGEGAVVRLLPRNRGIVNLGRIGLSKHDRQIFDHLLDLPHGMIIITGPTGSGKTTTLASALSILNQPHRKILTIEDPIEYDIPGICQSQIKPEIGFTFATALRSFVRQDPDVIMVGEVRDPETASIAVNAALTGHLVLTTLHTETAAAALPRLIDLGVDDFLLQSTIRAIVAQRLVRVLCTHCRKFAPLEPEQFEEDPRYRMIGLSAGDFICEPVGCERCANTGYRGRTGVFEILVPDEVTRQNLRKGIDAPSIEAFARAAGFKTMDHDAYEKIIAGTTSVSEVFRVVPHR